MHEYKRMKLAALADNQRDMEIISRPLAALNPDPANPRRHSKKQIRQIAKH